MEEIKRRLGYRYVLDGAVFSGEPEAGKDFNIELSLHNEGFSPVQNPRDAELVLVDASGKVAGIWSIDSDPRYWMPGQQITVKQTVTLPAGISGNVTLYLNLPDPCETLHDIRSSPSAWPTRMRAATMSGKRAPVITGSIPSACKFILTK